MSSILTETVYLDCDNVISLVLKENGEVVNLSAVTRMTLTPVPDDGKIYREYNAEPPPLVDSDVTAGAFDWTTYASSGKVILALGDKSIFSEDDLGKIIPCRLKVYDPSNTNGVAWGVVRLEIL